MKKTAILSSLAAALLLSAGAAMADHHVSGYWKDSSGVIVKDSYKECWRSGYWTPAMAVEGCDGAIAKKKEDKPSGPAAPAMKISLEVETLFDFDKAVLKDEGKAILDSRVVSRMKSDKTLEVVMITGHADRIGKDGYNQKLSEKRAAAVKDYLVAQGVEGNRLETAGKGEAEPKVDCADVKGKESGKNKALVECLQPNRRVDVRVKVQGN